MLENVGRKVVLILGLLGVAIGLLVFREKPFRMGLDLNGGRRLVYTLPISELKDSGKLPADTNVQALVQQEIQVIIARIDPTGVLESVIRQEGAERIVIELPGVLSTGGATRAGKLATATGEKDLQIKLDGTDPATLSGFPTGGGVVTIERERVRYLQRQEDVLFVDPAGRGFSKTPAGAHAAGTEVTLFSDDEIRNKIESLSELKFQIVADATDFANTGTDLQAELTRMREWAAKNPGASLAIYNRLPRAQGGPPEGMSWHPHKMELVPGQPPVPEAERAALLLIQPDPAWRFTGQDLDDVRLSQDDLGYPAASFRFKPAPGVAFNDFTTKYKSRNMALVLNGEIASAPTIDEPLPGRGIIRGKFTQKDVDQLMTVMRSGSLAVKPVLEHEERVGPTLGHDNIRRNLWAGAVSFLVVCGAMMAYYRMLGVFASISLLVNAVLLMGGMAFIDATLTLPGIGGIILTIGMALDANILIFDRIREEYESGKNVKMACKEGFEKAFTAIFDSNVTTLLSGLILYNVGSGPVRGFAVTLSIGILTTMFSQLVVTRVLVHYALARGVKEFKMGRWLADANYTFMRKAGACVLGSALLIGAGLALFASEPAKDKWGMEFTGGGTMMVRLEQPLPVERMREEVAKLPGDLANSEVKAVQDSEVGKDLYARYRITFKTDPEAEQSQDISTFEQEVRQGLEPVLQKGPVDVLVGGSATEPSASFQVFFEEPHPAADVQAVLAKVPLLQDVQIARDEKRPERFSGSARIGAGIDAPMLRSSIEIAFKGAKDSAGQAYLTASPVAEASVVGKQVVGELRDKALLAILLSMLVILLYVRVRFAEYSFGIGAIVALIHDVLVTVVACALAIKFGFINAEIDVTMISVFLTIIGYSVNDTIVIFDRVRENLPRYKKSLSEVLDISINQTLSRTILTSSTTFTSVLIMLIFNLGTGNALEGFCYAMLAGMISGVYSTIYIASPVLLWWENRSQKRKASKGGATPAKAATAS